MVSTTPNSGAIGVAPGSAITATFSEPVQSGTISFALKDASGNTLTGSVSYNAATNTATFTPNTPLAASTQYTATISGAQDLLGDVMTSQVSWSFTTASWSLDPGDSRRLQRRHPEQHDGHRHGRRRGDPGGSSFRDDFTEGSLSSAWTTTSWTSSGGGPTSVTLANSIVSVGGAEVLSTTTIPNGSGVEGSVNFGASPYQNFGMATDLSSTSGNYWGPLRHSGDYRHFVRSGQRVGDGPVREPRCVTGRLP